MTTEDVESIKEDIAAIKGRNVRVEAEKAWETSLTRKLSLAVATYVIAGVVLTIMDIGYAWRNALIPAIGYILSVQSLPVLKRTWMRRYLDRHNV